MIDERIAQRRREVRVGRQQRRLRRTLAVGAVVGLLAVLVAVERSPLVALEEVEVVGVERLTPAQVREAAGVPLGTSTLRLRLGRVERRVESLPLVREASARRVDPLTVRIEVVERIPVLLARGAGETVALDRDGVVLGAMPVGELPVVELPAAPPAAGDTTASDPALHNAFRVWRGLSGPLRAQVVTYHAAGAEELELVLRDGVRVRFGRAERLDEKVRALGHVLEDIAGETVNTIDVRAPSAPVVAR